MHQKQPPANVARAIPGRAAAGDGAAAARWPRAATSAASASPAAPTIMKRRKSEPPSRPSQEESERARPPHSRAAPISTASSSRSAPGGADFRIRSTILGTNIWW